MWDGYARIQCEGATPFLHGYRIDGAGLPLSKTSFPDVTVGIELQIRQRLRSSVDAMCPKILPLGSTYRLNSPSIVRLLCHMRPLAKKKTD